MSATAHIFYRRVNRIMTNLLSIWCVCVLRINCKEALPRFFKQPLNMFRMHERLQANCQQRERINEGKDVAEREELERMEILTRISSEFSLLRAAFFLVLLPQMKSLISN